MEGRATLKLIQGNIWLAKPPVMIVITTNSQVKASGELVMGAGIALEAARKAPRLPAECGKAVHEHGRVYGFLPIRHPRTPGVAGIGIFQTKEDWKDNANLVLIANSAKMLSEYARYNADIPIRLNYPGIGFGRLTKEQVGPILEEAFGAVENVSVYYV